MDFDQAIAAHGAWKSKLSDYLTKRDGSLKPADVSSDSACPLGKWIQGEGRQFSAMPEFTKLKNDHAHFHKTAADVLRRADAGEVTSAELALGAKSEFANASTAVVMAIMAMKKHTQKAAGAH